MEYRFTSEHHSQKSSTNWWIFLILSLCALAIWCFKLNQVIFLKLNPLHSLAPNSIWQSINYLTAPTHFILPIFLILITLFTKRDKMINVVTAVVIFYVLFWLLKHVVGEARPYMVLAPGTFFFLPSGANLLKIGYQSFPSGHAGNTAVFVFSLISMFFTRQHLIKWLFIFFLILVMLARICTGWHWPFDVLVSALIGYLVVKICWV